MDDSIAARLYSGSPTIPWDASPVTPWPPGFLLNGGVLYSILDSNCNVILQGRGDDAKVCNSISFDL